MTRESFRDQVRSETHHFGMMARHYAARFEAAAFRASHAQAHGWVGNSYRFVDLLRERDFCEDSLIRAARHAWRFALKLTEGVNV